MSAAERFWSKVDIRSEAECWEWTGHRHLRGYGIFWFDGKNVRANRMALLFSGNMPSNENLFALHSCDNPPCCNPSHLRWGTNRDNRDDFELRHGPIVGEKSPTSVITTAQADAILRGRIEGKGIRGIADELGLPETLVENVYVGSSWAHRHGVDGNPTLDELKRARSKRKVPAPNRVLTDQMIDHIFQSRMTGKSCSQIAKELGLPLGTISPVYSGVAFADRLGKHGNPTKEELVSVRAPNPTQKLTADDILEIKDLLREGYVGADIAEKYGVSRPTITRIKKML